MTATPAFPFAPRAAAFMTAAGVTFTERQADAMEDFVHGDSVVAVANRGEDVTVRFEDTPVGNPDTVVFPDGTVV